MRLSLRKGALLIALLSSVFFFVVAEEVATTAGSSDDKAAAEGVVAKLKAMLKDPMNYDKSGTGFSMPVPKKLLEKLSKVPGFSVDDWKDIKIDYNWGFGCSGLEEGVELEDGFKAIKGKVTPVVPAVLKAPLTNLLGSKIDTPLDLLKPALAPLKVGKFDPNAMLNKLMDMPEDIVLFMKLFFCGAAIKAKNSEAAQVVSEAEKKLKKQEALEFAVSQVTFLLARLAYTMNKAGEGTAKSMRYLQSGVSSLFNKLNAVFGDKLNDIVNEIKLPMSKSDYYWYTSNIEKLSQSERVKLQATGIPQTDLEKALSAAFAPKKADGSVKGYDGVTSELREKIVPMITNSLDYFDRKTLVAAISNHIDRIELALPDNQKQAMLDVRKKGIDALYTDVIAKMKEAGTFGAGSFGTGAPTQADLIKKIQESYANIGKKITPKDRFAKLAAISAPDLQLVPLKKAIDVVWAKFTLSILTHKFVSDPGYVDRSYMPLNSSEIISTSMALGFRVIKEATKMLKLKEALAKGTAKLENLKPENAALLKGLPLNIEEIFKKYLDLLKKKGELVKTLQTKKDFAAGEKVKMMNEWKDVASKQIPAAINQFKKFAVKGAYIKNLLKDELIVMFRRTQDFEVATRVLNVFLQPMGLTVDQVLETSVESEVKKQETAELAAQKEMEEEMAREMAKAMEAESFEEGLGGDAGDISSDEVSVDSGNSDAGAGEVVAEEAVIEEW
jgi:hypothetical protein